MGENMVLGWDLNWRGNTEVVGGDPVHVVEEVALGLNKDVQRYFAYRDMLFYFTELDASGTLTEALIYK